MTIRTNAVRAVLATGLSLALAGCHTPNSNGPSQASHSMSEYCDERPEICFLIGAVVIGGVVAIVANNSGSSSHHPGLLNGGGGTVEVSDPRLKKDMRFVGRLENGINLYAFRYVGDDRVFVGVDAGEIAADPRFAHAVRVRDGGFLAVDYHQLGLKVANAPAMRSAGERALALMTIG